MTDKEQKFNDPELQKEWEAYQDYLALHSGEAYYPMSFDEWRRKMTNKTKEQEEEKCDECENLKKTTWIKEPPKCWKHRKKTKIEYH